MLKVLKKNLVLNFLIFVFSLSLISRFFYLDFGLPYVFQADEVEMVEYSLKYAVNIKKILVGDLYFFKPFSFVYGTLPAYLNSILLIPFLKLTSLFSWSQDRYFIYFYLRIIYAIFSILTCLGVYFLSQEIIRNKKFSLLAAIIFSLNFYFYWLGKYLNNDILVVLFTVYFLLFYLRYEKTKNHKNLILAILFLGFGVSTKITFGIAVIYPFINFLIKKEYKNILIMAAIIFGTYFVTNPFTFIFPSEFIQRILEMRVKENGIVIDSYNPSYLKYLISLLENTTILVVLFSAINILQKIKNKKIDITIFVVLFYILFFTFSSRLVPRWVLPIYPLLIILALDYFKDLKNKLIKYFLIVVILIEIFIRFLLTNYELSLNSNFLKSYYFLKSEVSLNPANIYVVTQSGLNPFTSMQSNFVTITSGQFIPYVSEDAFNKFPLDPNNFDYIIFSSKVRDYYSNPFIKAMNPQYFQKWENFYQELNTSKFDKIANFSTPFASQIYQESVSIFKRK